MSGFKVLVNEKVDLILCDVVMPGFDGFKFLGLKKAKSEFLEIPVIMLTGEEDLNTKVRSLTAGASDYLTKPFHEEELVARVRIHMKIKLLQDELREKNGRLEELTRIDPLTQIPNRRYFMECFEREFSRAKRYGFPLSYVMCDLDHFKKLNDVHGHQAGDTALIKVASILKETLRDHDTCGRYGGEEFAVIMPGTAMGGARLQAEKIRRAVEALGIPHDLPKAGSSISISIGVATIRPSAERAPLSLVIKADEGLYLAKHSGRNQVAQASETTER